jgi:hypothetical protein
MNLTTINKAVKAAYHSAGYKGQGVTIAITDTGCNLKGVECVRGFDAPPIDGHGTMIAALLREWLPEARILSYNLRAGTFTDALKDILARAKQGGRYLVNISQGMWYDAEHERLINELVALNVPVFCAAGNDGGEGIGIYPSHYQAPICVAALNNDGSRANFSTFHNEVDFAEVGTGVLVYINGVGYVFNGTSIACPIALAKAAFMLCENPAMTEPQLFAAMKAAACDLGANGKDPYTGWGHVNVTPKTDKKEEKPMATKHITVCYGDSGAEVVLLKGYLVRLGYLKASTKPTFGGDTLRAVKAFQEAHGLKVDGECGPLTWGAVEKAIAELDKPKTLTALEQEFLAHLKAEVANGSIYVIGANGQKLITEAWIKRMEIIPSNASRAIALWRKRLANGCKNMKAFDCSGLISYFLQGKGLVEKKRNCNHLAGLCDKIHKYTGAEELQPMTLVFRWNGIKPYYHVGVYIGNGRVIESMGRDAGVVERDIHASGKSYWNRYGRLKALNK